MLTFSKGQFANRIDLFEVSDLERDCLAVRASFHLLKNFVFRCAKDSFSACRSTYQDVAQTTSKDRTFIDHLGLVADTAGY
jgi:hypothetical protein